jgi:acyl-CoA synthetase (AMP-forming)/AMP-acid ligase II
MSAWAIAVPATRLERHFGERVLRCFAERPSGLHALLAAAVERNPGGEALVCGAERYSWQALAAASAQLAAGLARRGIHAGDRVALCVGNCSEFVLAVYAAARLGAILVPLSIREQTPGLAYALNDCGASLLVHDADLAAKLPAPKDVPALRGRVALGACAGSEPWSALLQEAGSGAVPEPAAIDEEDTAAILYTSGTTGKPKGAMLTHLNLVHSVMHYEIAMGLTPQDRSVAAVPLSHVTGLVALIATMARCAATLVVMPEFRAADFLALAARERMTHTLLVPAMYKLCLMQSDFERHELSGWRIGAYGGAPMPAASILALAQKLPRLTLMNAYGATETCSPATIMPPGESGAHGGSVGRALPCAEIAVMDDAGREVGRGQAGEIWIKGPMVVKGYWNNPAATAESFTGGFWHSGDIGSVDADGFVSVFDRMKDMINRGGYKIYTIEVENALYEHPGVLECAVVAKPCPVLGERVHAFVTLRDRGCDANALAAFCAERLSDYKVPESFTLLDTPLPRNVNGKLLKRSLRDEVRG